MITARRGSPGFHGSAGHRCARPDADVWMRCHVSEAWRPIISVQHQIALPVPWEPAGKCAGSRRGSAGAWAGGGTVLPCTSLLPGARPAPRYALIQRLRSCPPPIRFSAFATLLPDEAACLGSDPWRDSTSLGPQDAARPSPLQQNVLPTYPLMRRCSRVLWECNGRRGTRGNRLAPRQNPEFLASRSWFVSKTLARFPHRELEVQAASVGSVLLATTCRARS